MTLGEVLRLLLAERPLGSLDGWSLSFGEIEDSDGEAWA